MESFYGQHTANHWCCSKRSITNCSGELPGTTRLSRLHNELFSDSFHAVIAWISRPAKCQCCIATVTVFVYRPTVLWRHITLVQAFLEYRCTVHNASCGARIGWLFTPKPAFKVPWEFNLDNFNNNLKKNQNFLFDLGVNNRPILALKVSKEAFWIGLWHSLRVWLN